MDPFPPPRSHPPPDIPGDRTLQAAKYLQFLGIISLIGLNLIGFIFLWFATKLRERNNRFRIATIWVCGFQAGFLLILMFAIAAGVGNEHMELWGTAIDMPRWEQCCIVLFGVILYLSPIPLLVAKATTYAFHKQTSPGLCPACGYDLRATPNRCPECGKVFRLSTI